MLKEELTNAFHINHQTLDSITKQKITQSILSFELQFEGNYFKMFRNKYVEIMSCRILPFTNHILKWKNLWSNVMYLVCINELCINVENTEFW